MVRRNSFGPLIKSPAETLPQVTQQEESSAKGKIRNGPDHRGSWWLHDWLKGTAFLLVLGSIATAIANEEAVRAPVEANSSAAQPDDRGRYLVKITGCNDCHTPGYAQTGGKIPEKDWLTGSSLGWRGPWGTTYAPNLRLFRQHLSEDEWVTIAHSAPSSSHLWVEK